ncbi:hypothetical protein PAMP_016244 [Pampus punctatissimus]
MGEMLSVQEGVEQTVEVLPAMSGSSGWMQQVAFQFEPNNLSHASPLIPLLSVEVS